jgi:DNA-binding transcriptional regulator YhcF (GntR family)
MLNLRKIDETDPRPAAQQIARSIVVGIAEGELLPGKPLPVRAELMSHYGVANSTIQAAIDSLKADGILVGRQGLGVFIRSGYSPVDMGKLVNWLTKVISMGEEDARQRHLIKIADPDHGVASVPLPPSGAGTIARRFQGERRLVELLSSPLPTPHSPDGGALRDLAASYSFLAGFDPSWSPDA